MAGMTIEDMIRAIVRDEVERAVARALPAPAQPADDAPEYRSCEASDHPRFAPPDEERQTGVEYLNDAGEWVAWDGTVQAARAWVWRGRMGHSEFSRFSTASGVYHDGDKCPERLAVAYCMKRGGGAANGTALRVVKP